MPIKFKIDHKSTAIQATAKGCISRRDLVEYVRAKEKAGAITYSEIFDARNIDADLSLTDLLAVEVQMREARGQRKPGKVAVVLNDGFLMGLGRAYAAIAREENPSFELFDEIEPARRWLSGSIAA